MTLGAAIGVASQPLLAVAAPWTLAPLEVFNDPPPGYWSTKVELADIDDNGFVDIIFANVGGYQEASMDSAMPNQVFLNFDGNLVDRSLEIFGPDVKNELVPYVDTARVIKAYDFDNDGDLDLLLGTAWGSRARFYRNMGGGSFVDESESAIPPKVFSRAGDFEVGDVDGDGDLDVMLTDWGPAPVGLISSQGAVTRLWLNDGDGVFTDATDEAMPAINVNWSWELEFIDIDNDWDLDVVISCRSCVSGGLLFRNDNGVFANATPGNLPQAAGSVDYEVMDLNGDDYVDLVALGDGSGGRNRVLLNTKQGGFVNATDEYWPPTENTPALDYMVAFADINADRLPDMVLGAFSDFADRVMINTGESFTTEEPWTGPITDGTYALAVGDLNNDYKIDVVLAEGENSFRNRVFLGTDVAIDSAKPVIQNHVFLGMWTIGETITIRARIHDNKSPNKDHDWTEIVFEYALDDDDIENASTVDLWWYGEYLWRTEFEVPNAKKIKYRICAEDAAGNRECTPVQETPVEDPNATDSETESDSMSDSLTDSMSDSMTDSMSDSVTDSMTDSMSDSVTDSMSESVTDSMSDSASASDSVSASASESVTDSASDSLTDSATITDSESDSATATGEFFLDDDGCDCNASDPGHGALTGLALLSLLGLRRRRRR